MTVDVRGKIVPIILILAAVSVSPVIFDGIFGVENDLYEFSFSTSGFDYDNSSLVDGSAADSVIGNGFFLSQDVNVSRVKYYCGNQSGSGLIENLAFIPSNEFYNVTSGTEIPYILSNNLVDCDLADRSGVVSLNLFEAVELPGGYYYTTATLYSDSLSSFAYELNVTEGNSTSISDGLVRFDGGAFNGSSANPNGITDGVVYSLYSFDYSVNERGSYTPAWFSVLLYLLCGVFLVLYIKKTYDDSGGN